MAGSVDASPPERGSRCTNLPVQLTTFVGRERERAEIGRLLAGSRLVTLTGPGGIGKTRLALEVAADAVEAYPDGAWLVELASLADPDLIPEAVATVLQVGEVAGQPLAVTVTDALRGRHLLLVLDNCEHLVQAGAELVDCLLRGCPEIRILATSREPLRVPGEVIWRVPSLAVPDPRVVSGTDEIGACEAVKLFVDRARSALPSFVLGDRQATGVAEICRRLDGIPLAIELAAARVRAFSVEHIAARSGDGFQILTGGSRTVLSRHQTLRRTIDWSHDLLSEPERILLRRLSVFAGGWALEAVEAVCAGGASGEGRRSRDEGREESDLETLAGLVEKSLVVLEEADRASRYRMLEPIRRYAEERLLASGEAAVVRRSHVDWFVALAERAAPELSGPDQAAWFELLEREHDNLRAALQWILDRREAELALRLSGALGLFWIVRGHRTEGSRWFEQALALSPWAGGAHRGKALGLAGYLARLRNNPDQAVALCQEALAVRREVGDQHGIARSLHDLAELARDRGDYARAMPLLEEARVIQGEIGDQGGLGMTLRLLGRVAYDQGDTVTARAIEEESLVLFRDLGDEHRVAHELDFLGVVVRAQGDRRLATELHEQGLAIFERIADKDGVAQALLHLGRLALDRGDGPSGAALCLKSLLMWQELDAPGDAAPCFEALAEAALASGRAEQATRLLGAAEALREVVRVPLSPAERRDFEAAVAAARAKLGTGAFEAARAAGRGMSLAQAAECARAAATSPLPPRVERTPEPAPAVASSPLTPREREVAALIARGRSNRQIGEALVITEGTANLHVKHILGKLGFASRAEIAAWAVRQEIVSAVDADRR